MNFFYYPEISGFEITLPEEESRHCIRVLRLKKNESLYLVDGKGTLYRALLVNPDIRKAGVKIVERIPSYRQRIHYLHIAIAPTKNTDRFEWFLEKATEIGIDEITPIICTRSERKTVHSERAKRILVAAMKQSQRAYLPRLNPIKTYNEIIAGNNAKCKIITHCNVPNLPLLSNGLIKDSPAVILIGPEGDFTLQEVEMAIQKGFAEASLGPFVYRTETAGVMACHEFNLLFRQ
jgi:16S rRNA (uracil1498-N3)-methyltransferase